MSTSISPNTGQTIIDSMFNSIDERKKVYHHTQYPADLLPELLSRLKSTKSTGTLTVHFDQGTPRGTVEWKQKG